MRLKLLLPEVKPGQIQAPRECARKGCKGKRFYPRQEVRKGIVDAKYRAVSAWRFECASCGCTFKDQQAPKCLLVLRGEGHHRLFNMGGDMLSSLFGG